MARKKSARPDERTINLSSGGTVTVALAYSAFDLDGHDRDFVTELVDLLQAYETQASSLRSTGGSGDEKKVQAKKGQQPMSEEPDSAT